MVARLSEPVIDGALNPGSPGRNLPSAAWHHRSDFPESACELLQVRIPPAEGSCHGKCATWRLKAAPDIAETLQRPGSGVDMF
jgi:hypothetical protein